MKSEERYGHFKGIEKPTRVTVLPHSVGNCNFNKLQRDMNIWSSLFRS